jgi:sugar lactone lactonase YvrE
VTALPTATGGTCAAAPPSIRTCVQSLALSPDGNTLYVGGAFTSLGGIPRSHIAAVDTTTLAVTGFNPGADGDVRALAASPDGRIYVGGTFSTIAGSSQANLAALTAAGNVDGLWSHSPSGGSCSLADPALRACVNTLAVSGDGSRVYVGGDFTDVSGTSQPRLAALITTQFGWTMDSSFDPRAGGALSALALDGNRLYAAGSFSSIGGRDDRRFLAALDADSGNTDPAFDPRPGAATLAVAVSGGRVYAGGLFTSVNGFPRANLAAIDAATGQLDMGFQADTERQVNAVVADASGGLFIGGQFMRVGRESRHKVARVDAATGAVDLAWKAQVSAEVLALAVSGSRLYLGGLFSTITSGGSTFPRSKLAAVGTATGAVEGWNPNLDTAVYDIDFSPDQSLVYVAGSFNNVGTTSRKNLAAITAAGGQATSWNPIVPMPTRKVSVSADGARVYVAVAGGDKDGNKVQGFNTGTGAKLWEHKGDGDFTGLDISGALVYAGGHFDNITDLGQPRQHLAAFDQITGAITPWGPSIAGVHGILDLEVHDTALLIAGEFRRVTGAVQQGWARFANSPDGLPPTTATTLPPGATPPGPGPGGGGGGRSGYWMVGSDGKVYNFGDSAHHGNTPPLAGTEGVDLEPTPSGNGYWVVTSAGQVYGYGDARWIGNLDPAKVAKDERATSLSATRSGNGYWIFTNKGRVLPFGDATHYGDMAATRLNGPVLDSIPTASGKGYYMVASDGGIFSFGDAKFHGSMGGKRLNAPVQSLVPDGDGVGYWLVASDGGIFSFEAPFKGSMGDKRLNKPVTGMVRFGNGYLMVGEDGGIFNFSDKPFFGSLGNNPPARPIVSVAALG